MQRHERSPRLRVIALAATLMVGLWQGVALAGPNGPNVSGPEAPSVDSPPAPDAGDGPEAPSAPNDEAPSAPSAPSGSSNTSSQAPAAPQPAQPEPQDDGDTGGHETANVQDPPHAAGSVADATLGGELNILAGSTNAQVDPEDGDSSSADATILAIGGEDVVPGVSADSDGETHQEQGALIACDPSGGAICVGLLFAQATATEDDDSSDASASTSLVFACLGGSNTAPTNSEECTGAPVVVGVSESDSEIHKNKRTGGMTADQETRAANACVGGEDPITGACSGAGAEVLESESHSAVSDDNGNGTATDDEGTTTRRSCVVGLQLGPQAVEPICAGNGEDGQTLAIGPGLPDQCEATSLVCVFANQGEAAVYAGGAWSRQEALHVVLPGPVGELINAHLVTAETLVQGQVAERVQPLCPDGVTPIPPGGVDECPNGEPPERFCPDGTPIPEGETREDFCPGGGGDGDGDIVPRGGLAVTGAGLLPLFAVSLVLAAGGVGAITSERRRRHE